MESTSELHSLSPPMASSVIHYSRLARREARSKGRGQEWTQLWCNEGSADLNDPHALAQYFIIYHREQDINATEDLLAEK